MSGDYHLSRYVWSLDPRVTQVGQDSQGYQDHRACRDWMVSQDCAVTRDLEGHRALLDSKVARVKRRWTGCVVKMVVRGHQDLLDLVEIPESQAPRVEAPVGTSQSKLSFSDEALVCFFILPFSVHIRWWCVFVVGC